MPTPIPPDVQKALYDETDARFWTSTGYQPGVKLDPKNPLDAAKMPVWANLSDQVLAQYNAGTLTFTHAHPVIAGLIDAAKKLSSDAADAFHRAATVLAPAHPSASPAPPAPAQIDAAAAHVDDAKAHHARATQATVTAAHAQADMDRQAHPSAPPHRAVAGARAPGIRWRHAVRDVARRSGRADRRARASDARARTPSPRCSPRTAPAHVAATALPPTADDVNAPGSYPAPSSDASPGAGDSHFSAPRSSSAVPAVFLGIAFAAVKFSGKGWSLESERPAHAACAAHGSYRGEPSADPAARRFALFPATDFPTARSRSSRF